MAGTRDRIKSAARALIVALIGLAIVYFVLLLLLSGSFGLSTSSSGGIVLERPPVTLPQAISLIQQGQVQLISIRVGRDDEQFLTLPSPYQPKATPIQQWAVRGYVVELYPADEGDGLAVLGSGGSTIGLDDVALSRLLQEVDKTNQAEPCRVVVLDQRSAQPAGPMTSPTNCPVPTGPTMSLSPEQGRAEGIARPPLSVAEARQMILDGHVEVLRLQSEVYPDGVQRAYRYVEDGNQQLLQVRGIDVMLYDLSRPDPRPVTNSSTTVGVSEAELQSLLAAVREAKTGGKDTQVIDERN